MQRLVAIILMCACGMLHSIPFAHRPANERELDLMAGAMATYAESVGDPGDDCRAILPAVVVAYLVEPELGRACGQGPGLVNGCYRGNDGLKGSVSIRRRTHILVVNAGESENKRDRLVIHEFFHVLERCDGRPEFFHRKECERDERGQYVTRADGTVICEVVYAPGWREAELEAQRRAGLR